MKKTKEEAALTRQALLDAALTVFSRAGYRDARLEDIADAAGVTRGAIYHHFGSKVELYLALVERASAQGNEAIRRAIEEGGTFVEVVKRIMTYSLTLLEEDRHFREVMALSLSLPGIEASDELLEVSRLRSEQAETLVQSIAGFMRQGIAQGDLRAGLDALTAARAFIGYQNGLASLWLANRKAFSIRKSAAELADIYMQGIVA